MSRKIRFAIPNKGRLYEPCLNLLEKVGLKVKENGRSYICSTENSRYEVIFARAFDIPIYVEYGSIDLGITGLDLVQERVAKVHHLINLDFGECQLVVAVPKDSSINNLKEIESGVKVSTEYPKITDKYFKSYNKQVEILEVRGATELAPKLGLTEIIVDLTSTGETLRKNNLRIIETILKSTSVLVCNKLSYKLFEDEIQSLLNCIRESRREEN